jgi:hypothetical protein
MRLGKFKVAIYREGQTGDSCFLFFLGDTFMTKEEAQAAANKYERGSLKSHYAYVVRADEFDGF